MTGEYAEPLPCGGKLKVTPPSWSIDYYFPGPDARYNGDFKRVSGAEVEAYIDAWVHNYDEFVALKGTVPAGGSFQKPGAKGVTIRIEGWSEGVCLVSYHLTVSTKEDLDRVMGSYQYATERAASDNANPKRMPWDTL